MSYPTSYPVYHEAIIMNLLLSAGSIMWNSKLTRSKLKNINLFVHWFSSIRFIYDFGVLINNCKKEMQILLYQMLLLSMFRMAEGLSCTKQLSTCSCVTDEGPVLNFSALDAGGYNKIMFRRYDDSVGIPRYIEYNPCTAFICNGGDTAAVCCDYSATREEAIFGIQSTARFIGTLGKTSIILRYFLVNFL